MFSRTLPVLLRGAAPSAVLLLGLAGGCSQDKTPETKACCDQPKIPAGVPAFRIVADDVTGPSDGQTVHLKVTLEQATPRDSLYPVLHTLYRYALTRTAFEPINFDAHVFASESDARAGSKPVASIERNQGELAPKCENAIPYSFEEQVARGFAALQGGADEEDSADTCHMNQKKKVARHDDGYTHKPSYKVDAAARAVSISWPYLTLGKDEYNPALRGNEALAEWIDVTTQMFRRVPDLKRLSFAGLQNDQPVVRVDMTREQFQAGLAGLQEDIASHAAITFASLGMKKTDDKGALKEQEAFKAKTYKAALATLPKQQVSVSPKLK